MLAPGGPYLSFPAQNRYTFTLQGSISGTVDNFSWEEHWSKALTIECLLMNMCDIKLMHELAKNI